MNKALLSILIVFPFICCQCTKAHLPVRLAEHLGASSVSGLRPQLSQPVEHPNQGGYIHVAMAKGDKKVNVTLPKDYPEYHRLGYHPECSENWTLLAEESQRLSNLVRLLEGAKPSHRSYLQDFSLKDHPVELLSAGLGLVTVSGDEVDPETDALIEKVSSEAQILSANRTSLVLDFPDNGLVAIDVLAWGDFNHDGIEDVLLDVHSHLRSTTLGNFRYHYHAVLTRRAPKGPLALLATEAYAPAW